MLKKVCTKCNTEKSISDFYKNKNSKDGLSAWCKECQLAYHKIKDKQANVQEERKKYYKQRYIRNKEKLDKQAKEYYDKNKQKVQDYRARPDVKIQRAQYMKAYQEKNKEKLTEYDKNYKQNNAEKIKEYYTKNREKCLQYSKDYYTKNKEQKQKYQQENKDRRNTYNNTYKQKNKLAFNFSNNMRFALKGTKSGCHWETLVPYSLQQLKEYLESQFTPEMSWNNYGSYWEVDHIIPQNLFNFTNPTDKEFQICWSLKNLRPLEKIANRNRPKDGRDIPEELKQQILNS